MMSNTEFLFKANIENIDVAVNSILNGDVIIYPTDTLYSFGADAGNSEAIIKLNNIKKRKAPLSILLSNISEIENYGLVNEDLIEKIKTLLPGPFTILLESRNHSKISNLVQLDSNLIGIRIINNSFCNTLINKINRPIITTSVNIHGEPSLNDVSKIKGTFPELNMFYNKKELISKGSTIIDLSVIPEKIIRYGEGKYISEIL